MARWADSVLVFHSPLPLPTHDDVECSGEHLKFQGAAATGAK